MPPKTVSEFLSGSDTPSSGSGVDQSSWASQPNPGTIPPFTSASHQAAQQEAVKRSSSSRTGPRTQAAAAAVAGSATAQAASGSFQQRSRPSSPTPSHGGPTRGSETTPSQPATPGASAMVEDTENPVPVMLESWRPNDLVDWSGEWGFEGLEDEDAPESLGRHFRSALTYLQQQLSHGVTPSAATDSIVRSFSEFVSWGTEIHPSLFVNGISADAQAALQTAAVAIRQRVSDPSGVLVTPSEPAPPPSLTPSPSVAGEHGFETPRARRRALGKAVDRTPIAQPNFGPVLSGPRPPGRMALDSPPRRNAPPSVVRPPPPPRREYGRPPPVPRAVPVRILRSV